ncbi:MAG: fibronectin type III domain-containing protein [Promethearchaeota archaeon]
MQDTTDPVWIVPPIDATILLGDSFYQDVEASDLSDVSYSIDDTTNFAIDSATGVITNAIALAVGTYSLRVTAEDAYLNSISVIIEITVSEDFPPSQVTGLTAVVVSETEINLNWDANMETDFDHYIIYRDGIKITETTLNQYSDTGLVSGMTYTYEVSAVDASGQEGLKSDPVSATTSKPIEQILNDIMDKLDELGDLIDEKLDGWKRISCRIYLSKAKRIVEYMIEKVDSNEPISHRDICFLKIFIGVISWISRDSEIRQLCSEINSLIYNLQELI